MQSLFRAVLAAELEHDSHESDLYLRDTPAARALLKERGLRIEPFRCRRTGEWWLDIPFAYDPAWSQR